MLALVMLLPLADYSAFLWGWCLLKGYNVTLGELVNPVHPYSGTWPPPPIPDTQVWPSSSASQSAAEGTGPLNLRKTSTAGGGGHKK